MYRTNVQNMAGYLLQHANDHWFQSCIKAKWEIITHLQLFQEILSSCQNNKTAGWEEEWDQFKLALRLKKLMQSQAMGVWKTQLYPTVELVHNIVHCSMLTTSAQKMSYSSSLYWRTPSASGPTDQQKLHQNQNCDRFVNQGSVVDTNQG